jgi:hypothetical protein
MRGAVAQAAGSTGVMDDGAFFDGTLGFTDKTEHRRDGTALTCVLTPLPLTELSARRGAHPAVARSAREQSRRTSAA